MRNADRELVRRAVKLAVVILLVLGAFTGGLMLAASRLPEALRILGGVMAVMAPLAPLFVAAFRLASEPAPHKPDQPKVGFFSRAHAPPRRWEGFFFLGAGALSGAWAAYLLAFQADLYGVLWLFIAFILASGFPCPTLKPVARTG
jgi:disulfide bond formation protein DsbB